MMSSFSSSIELNTERAARAATSDALATVDRLTLLNDDRDRVEKGPAPVGPRCVATPAQQAGEDLREIESIWKQLKIGE